MFDAPLDDLPAFSTSLVVSLSLFIVYSIVQAIQNLFISSLKDIPGPWYAALSDLWLTTHTLRLHQCQQVHSLFEQYGPVVRVGPKKVFFNDPASSKSVYTIHKFDKSMQYKSLVTNDGDVSVTILDHASHAIRRKSFAPHFALGNLMQFEPEMQEHTLELISAIDSVAGKSSMECLRLLRQLMMDLAVTTSFGYRLNALRKYTSTQIEDPMSVAIGDFPKRALLRGMVPAWVWNLICKFPNATWQRICDSDRIMSEFVIARVHDLRAQDREGKLDNLEKVPLLHRLLHYRYPNEELMPDRDIISEAIGQLFAGTDTMSISMSYFLWELSRRPDVATQLRKELDASMPDPKTIPDMTVLNNLPYLNAVIKEGLRLYTAAPSALERVVPATVSKSGTAPENYDLMGYMLPPGTIVATQAWSMHREPSVFPSPDFFSPERWLVDDSEELSQMTAQMMAFGLGSRNCGGQTFAYMTMRMVLASIARNFDIVAAPGTDEKSMAMRDAFVIFPSAMECNLYFKPRV